MFTPTNGNLLVEVQSTKVEDQQSELLLPEGYTKRSEYEVGKIVSIAKDCVQFKGFQGDVGKMVVFPSNMLIELNLNENQIFLVKENYVIGTYIEND